MILLSQSCPWALASNAPGSFPALMDLYECNYINLRRLIPVLPTHPMTLVSQCETGLALHLRLFERFRYTSELSLTYHFSEQGVLHAAPNLRLRIYHDARLAEVLYAYPRHLPAFDTDNLAFQHLHGTPLHRRWKVNRFLFKWLQYCLRQGHRFIAPPSPPPSLSRPAA